MSLARRVCHTAYRRLRPGLVTAAPISHCPPVRNCPRSSAHRLSPAPIRRQSASWGEAIPSPSQSCVLLLLMLPALRRSVSPTFVRKMSSAAIPTTQKAILVSVRCCCDQRCELARARCWRSDGQVRSTGSPSSSTCCLFEIAACLS